MSEPQPTILFAVRHGETQWNRAGIQQGHMDSPLTDRGVEQARSLAEGLADRQIEVIYASDLGRAMRTAEIIAERLALPVQPDDRLRERHLGVMQGLTYAQFRERQPDVAAAYENGGPDYELPGGESARQRFERHLSCVADLASRHAGQRVLIVVHGGVLNSLLSHTMGLPLDAPRRFSLFNAAINRFTVRGDDWRLDTWGDLSHLEGSDALDDF